MRYLLLLIVSLGISGCTPSGASDPLCAAIANPDRYVGKRLTLAGQAQMHQHSSTLRSEACPDKSLLLKLDPSDSSDVSKGKLSPAGAFFTELARRQASSVMVSGQMIRTQGAAVPYALVVESGAHSH
ncbi:hypothetical protein GCM10027431_09620 [Lysobacter rhizosphaerae]